MRTTVDLPKPLIENAKALAAKRGGTLSGVIEDALRSHLALKIPVSGRPFHLPTVRGRLVNAALDLDRTSAFSVADDETAFASRR